MVAVQPGQLTFQRAPALHEQRPVDRLVRDLHARIIRELLAQLHGDLVNDTLLALDTTTEAVGLAAAGAGIALYEMTTERVDLEDMFLELTATMEGN